jgi:hypothetical protein
MRLPDTKPNRTYTPAPDEIPSGICECGCGEQTPLSTYTNRNLRYFSGYPRPFIPEHGRHMGRGAPGGSGHYLFVGRRIRDGYVYVYRPDRRDAPSSGNFAGYVREHRVTWEEANGRQLRDDECVHHINGIRDDNRPDNLVALTRSAHRSLHRKDDTMSEDTRRKLSEGAKRQWARAKRQDKSRV